MSMPMIRRSRTVSVGIVAVLALTLITPIAVTAQEQDPALAPVAGPSWDETSGYGAVEAIRAEPDLYGVPAAGTTADAASSSGSVAANRVTTAQHALQAGDLGSMQEEALTAIVATGASWDETSGYGSVEASRAAIGHPAAITTQVPSDVRWAPSGSTEPGSSIGASRVNAAQRALQSHDLGSLQEEALAAVVASGTASDETRSPAYVPAALARGTRAESALLWTILQDDPMMANSDDRIANALFGDQSSGYGSVEASRAGLLAQFRAVELSSSSSLGAAQQETASCDAVS